MKHCVKRTQHLVLVINLRELKTKSQTNKKRKKEKLKGIKFSWISSFSVLNFISFYQTWNFCSELTTKQYKQMGNFRTNSDVQIMYFYLTTDRNNWFCRVNTSFWCTEKLPLVNSPPPPGEFPLGSGLGFGLRLG